MDCSPLWNLVEFGIAPFSAIWSSAKRTGLDMAFRMNQETLQRPRHRCRVSALFCYALSALIRSFSLRHAMCLFIGAVAGALVDPLPLGMFAVFVMVAVVMIKSCQRFRLIRGTTSDRSIQVAVSMMSGEMRQTMLHPEATGASIKAHL